MRAGPRLSAMLDLPYTQAFAHTLLHALPAVCTTTTASPAQQSPDARPLPSSSSSSSVTHSSPASAPALDTTAQPVTPTHAHQDAPAQPAEPVDFIQTVCGHYSQDPLFNDSARARARRTRLSITLTDGLYYKAGRLVLPRVPAVLSVAMSEVHCGHLQHLGLSKTIKEVLKRFWWPGLRKDVAVHVRQCSTCQRVKHLPGTEQSVQPLPPPDGPWTWVTTDLVCGLPRTKHGNNAIAVFVDRFSKMAHFIPCNTAVTAAGYADIYLKDIYRLHGLPSTITSDRDPRFTSDFWAALHRQLSTKLKMGTAYHPQTDGQSESTIKTLTTLLRAAVLHVGEQEWELSVPLIEFAYNSAPHSSTGLSPFQVVYNRQPRGPLDVALGLSEPTLRTVQQSRDIYRYVHQQLQRTAARMKSQSTPKQTVTFQPGQSVLLSTKILHFPAQTSRKLLPTYMGPFPVLQDHGNSAEIRLPESMARIHPRINKQYLRPFYPSSDPSPDNWSQLAVEPARPRYIERVLSVDESGNPMHHKALVRFTGFDASGDRWVKLSELDSDGVLKLQEYQQSRAEHRQSVLSRSDRQLRSNRSTR